MQTLIAPAAPCAAQATEAPPLRRGELRDAEAWQRLQLGIYAEGEAFVGDAPANLLTLEHLLRTLQGRHGLVLFAVNEADEPIGYLELRRAQPRRLAHVAYLTLAVAPAWRRRGVGRALLAAAFAWASEYALGKLQLHVRAGNLAAIALYQRFGFEREGVLRDQVAVAAGRFEDEWVMAWRAPVRAPDRAPVRAPDRGPEGAP